MPSLTKPFRNLGIRGSLLALTAIVATLGIARTWDPGAAVVGKEKVELTFWNGFTGPDGRTMLEIIRDFNKENPDIQVSMQRMDWGTYYNKLMVAAMDSRGPQLFVLHSNTLARMTRAGYIADSSSLFAGPDAIPPSDFDPYVLKQVKFGETYFGVPLDIHPQGLYTNADELKSHGFVDANGNAKPPANKEEFLRAIKALKTPTTWGFALTMWRNNFQSLVPQFGGRFLDENGNVDLNNPGNMAALTFLGQLTKDHLVPPPENGLGWVGYRQKKVAMVWEGVYMLGDLKRLEGMNYLAAPIPQIGPRPGTIADSHVLCVRKGISDKQRDAAHRFIRYLSTNSIRWAGAGQVPARKSVRELPEFKAMPVQSAFAAQIPHMMYPPRTTVLFELNLEIDLAVEKVIRGNADAKTALGIANSNAQKAIDRDRAESKMRGVQP